MAVSNLYDVDINILHSATEIYLSNDILSPGLRLFGIIMILRADLLKIVLGRRGL